MYIIVVVIVFEMGSAGKKIPFIFTRTSSDRNSALVKGKRINWQSINDTEEKKPKNFTCKKNSFHYENNFEKKNYAQKNKQTGSLWRQSEKPLRDQRWRLTGGNVTECFLDVVLHGDVSGCRTHLLTHTHTRTHTHTDTPGQGNT